MDVTYINQIVQRAAMIATERALKGHPVEFIRWIPPQSASEDIRGNFAIAEYQFRSAGDTPPWE